MSDQILQQILKELKSIKEDQEAFKNDQKYIKENLEILKNDQKSIKEDQEAFKNDQEIIKSTMASKHDVKVLDNKLDRISEKIDLQHIENINSDNRLLNEISSIKENVVFVNRKVADAELEINSLKHRKQ